MCIEESKVQLDESRDPTYWQTKSALNAYNKYLPIREGNLEPGEDSKKEVHNKQVRDKSKRYSFEDINVEWRAKLKRRRSTR